MLIFTPFFDIFEWKGIFTMIDQNDIDRLEKIFVTHEECNDVTNGIGGKLANDSTRFAVLEERMKVNNWLTTGICAGIVALLIKVFLGG